MHTNVFALQTILRHESLDRVKRCLKIAQTDLQKAHQDAGPVMNWLLKAPPTNRGRRPAASALQNCRSTRCRSRLHPSTDVLLCQLLLQRRGLPDQRPLAGRC
jgi:hypothetical protein